MILRDAIELMTKGGKMSHRFFSEGEYITMKANTIITEDGYECSLEEFLSIRNTSDWQSGWYEVK